MLSRLFITLTPRIDGGYSILFAYADLWTDVVTDTWGRQCDSFAEALELVEYETWRHHKRVSAAEQAGVP